MRHTASCENNYAELKPTKSTAPKSLLRTTTNGEQACWGFLQTTPHSSHKSLKLASITGLPTKEIRMKRGSTISECSGSALSVHSIIAWNPQCVGVAAPVQCPPPPPPPPPQMFSSKLWGNLYMPQQRRL